MAREVRPLVVTPGVRVDGMSAVAALNKEVGAPVHDQLMFHLEG